MYAIFYTAIERANPTDELVERFKKMTLPDPFLPREGPVESGDILYFYPEFIWYLKSLVRSLQYGSTYDWLT